MDKVRAARQRKQRGKPAGKPAGEPAKKKPRGKPFPKGNPFRWKPGESGNPAGNADTLIVRAALLRNAQREAGDDLEDVDGLTWLDRIAVEALKRAIKDTEGFKEFADRVDGKPTTKGELSGPNGGPIPIALDEALNRIYGNPDNAGEGAPDNAPDNAPDAGDAA